MNSLAFSANGTILVSKGAHNFVCLSSALNKKFQVFCASGQSGEVAIVFHRQLSDESHANRVGHLEINHIRRSCGFDASTAAGF